ncbi:hypothetical protein D3C76_1390860 [compost metagenome]
MNGNMSFLLASSFIDKNVELTEKNSDDQYITGTVTGVLKENGIVNIKLKVDGTGEELTVSVDKISKVNKKD